METTMKAIDKTRTSAGVNSEHLFALESATIGYAACFDTALAMTAQRMKKVITSSTTSAKFAMGRIGDRGYPLGIDLYVEVCGLPKREARQLVETTHRVCPYSDAVRSNVDIRLHVTVA